MIKKKQPLTEEPCFKAVDREAVNVLAKYLADNYFDVTFGYPDPPMVFGSNYAKVFRGQDGKEASRSFIDAPRVRNVVVIGAGASYAGFGPTRFPMASDAIERLRESLGVGGLQQALRLVGGSQDGPKDRIAEEELRFEQLYDVPDARHDFESQLTILSKFYTLRQIQEALAGIYSPRHYPHITFETIAHLLKHRFVDVVINYNFDEVLDQAIEEELQGGDYRKVISDGDCDELSKLVVDEQLKVPVYIKPHGTIRHKSTLRFTKDAYIGMPSGLLAFTQKLLLGDTKEDTSQQRDRYHVNLISIGFAFTSVELIEMLKGHKRLRVFHFNVAKESIKRDLWKNVRQIGEQVEQYFIGTAPSLKDAIERASSGTLEFVRPASPASDHGEPKPSTVLAPDVDVSGHPVDSPSASTVDTGEQPPVVPPTCKAAHGEPESGACSPSDKPFASTQQAVTQLFMTVREYFNDEYSPREITRHWFVHSLLFSTKPESSSPVDCGVSVPTQDRYYFLARLYIELTLALAKGNGRIDLSTLVQSRVGIYFREWIQVEPGGGVSLRAICKNLQLVDNGGFGGNVFTTRDRDTRPVEHQEGKDVVEPQREDEKAAEPRMEREGIEAHAEEREEAERKLRELESASSRVLAVQLWNSLMEALNDIDEPDLKAHLDAIRIPEGQRAASPAAGVGSQHDPTWPTATEEQLIGYLQSLVRSDVQELAPRFSPDAMLLLNRISPTSVIHTHLGITTRLIELVEENDWDLLLAITEQGKVLRKLAKHLSRKQPHPAVIRRRASVIVADAPDPTVMNARLALYKAGEEPFLIGGDYRLPYWAHNDHMVVVLRMGVHPGTFHPLGAISYRKEGLENRVNPVAIGDRDDLDRLVNTYFGMVAKAIAYRPENVTSPDAAPTPKREHTDRVQPGYGSGVPDIGLKRAADIRRSCFKEWWDAMYGEAEAKLLRQGDGTGD